VGFAIIFGTQYLYEDSWFQWSGPAIESLQSQTSAGVYSFFKFYTNVGGGTLQVIYMVIFAIFFYKKDEAVILGVNLSI
jgi:predicted PurR-regulated permease PerM